jgi:hypothetical protein
LRAGVFDKSATRSGIFGRAARLIELGAMVAGAWIRAPPPGKLPGNRLRSMRTTRSQLHTRGNATMAAVFSIVSRQTGKALTAFVGDSSRSAVFQMTQGAEGPDQTQSWTLEANPGGSAQDFLIHPDGFPGLAISTLSGPAPQQPSNLRLDDSAWGTVWRISPIANPRYFFLFEASADLLMDVTGGSDDDGVPVQVYYRNENQNQQWTFLPVFSRLGA